MLLGGAALRSGAAAATGARAAAARRARALRAGAARRRTRRSRSSGRSLPPTPGSRRTARSRTSRRSPARWRSRAWHPGTGRRSCTGSRWRASRSRAWALLTKIFPGALAEDEIYARLRAPFDYWNSVGLTAAIGVLALLWLGARRSGRAAVNALAWPGIALLEVALMLSYSRGALLALLAGLAFWFAVVPLRLRGAVVLLGATAGAAALVGWAFTMTGLTHRPAADRGARRHRPRARRAAAAAAGAAARARPRRGLPGRRAAGLAARPSRSRDGVLLGVLAADPGDPARRARERPGRHRRPGVEGLGPAHQPQRGDAVEHAEPPDRDLLGARALLGGGVRRARRLALGRDRRGRLRDGAQPLPDRDAVRAPRPRLRAADAGRPRLGGAGAVAARARPLGLGRAARRRDCGRATAACRGTPSASVWRR